MKIVQALEDSNILLKRITKKVKNQTKEQKGGFLTMLLGTLGASLLRNLLTGKGILRDGTGNKNKKELKKLVLVVLGKKMGFLMPLHPLTNFEIRKNYKSEPRFNGDFSRNNLPRKIKDGANVINFDEYADVGTHWIAIFCNRNEIVYFNSFGIEHVPVEIKEFIGNRNIKANIFRVQANTSVMCG